MSTSASNPKHAQNKTRNRHKPSRPQYGNHFRRRETKIDPQCQEATPEHLRIEIDNIFKEFLGDPDKTEHIFPSDLNNLQRKYIHAKAQKMNIVSKSYGREPDRQLHIKKKQRQIVAQNFELSPGPRTLEVLHTFRTMFSKYPQSSQRHRAVKRNEKVYGKLLETEPVVPKPSYAREEVLNVRKSLPIFEKRQEILDAINNNQIVILSSETGSGKTTQVPQFIMEDMASKGMACKVICTQPRRISTVAAAERVSYERGDVLGASVGYHIRLESKSGYNTCLMYCTVGVFLRNLMCGHKCLNNITHVIIDEIHERDKLSDFLLICIRQHLVAFPHLRLILMSATVDTNKFTQYFQSGMVLSIPGRLFPIQTYFLEDILGVTQYFTAKMRTAAGKLNQTAITGGGGGGFNVQQESEGDCSEVNADMDFALDEYMNFSDHYDYKIHYEEATAQLIMYFLSEGVSVNYQHSRNGRTALMIAAHLGDKEFISRLCSMGADLNLYCKLGKTAFDYGKNGDQVESLRLLEYIRDQNFNRNGASNADDSQRLLQLYDMTTPDDVIDYDLIASLVSYIHKSPEPGSLLIFLPGYDEIMQCNDRILDTDLDPNTFKIFFLHSSMNIRDQCDVFKQSYDKRKIILATNIAETSITIEDVVFVIDVGKAKEKVFDSYNKLSSLQTQWISKACAKQREGRAGRVRPGFCFRLYSKQRFTNMDEDRVPEILRVSLEELCLNAKIIAPKSVNIYTFLSLAPDPPSLNSVKVAVENLQSLGALDNDEDLTVLGEYLAQLTVEPRLGKMLIYSCIFRCLDPILTIVSAMAHKDPFQLPPQANLKTMAAQKRKELAGDVLSDHIIYLKVFQAWQELNGMRARRFCKDYFLSESTLHMVLDTRRQLLAQLRALGFVHNSHSLEEYNVNAHSWGTVKAVMSTAYYPNVAHPSRGGFATRSEKKVTVHNTSVCAKATIGGWVLYDEMVKNRINFMIKGVTVVTPFTVAIMCGINSCSYPEQNSLVIDDFMEFTFPNPLVLTFREAVDGLISQVLSSPSYIFDDACKLVVHTFRETMDVEELSTGLVQPVGLGARPKFLFRVGDNTRPGQSRTNNDLVELHKKGRTPKRFPARDQKPHEHETESRRSLRFDNPTNGRPILSHNYDETRSLFSGLNIRGNEYEVNNENASQDPNVYVLIRAGVCKNVRIAYKSSRWVFAPQTEKKIIQYKNERKIIYLLFYVRDSGDFMGIARFKRLMTNLEFGKPTAQLQWIYTTCIERDNLKHMREPGPQGKLIFDADDGTIIRREMAEELFRIYREESARTKKKTH